MKVRETLQGLILELRDAGVEPARAEAEILMAAAIGLLDAPRAAVYEARELELSGAQARTLAALALRRRAGEPVQYVVGRAWFRDLVLEVGPGVLVPRPETEVLVERVLEWLGPRPGRHRVLDLGTGSGCIALALAQECGRTQVLGTDLSEVALRYASANRARLATTRPDAARRVSYARSDLFAGLSPAARFEVIVSNPPYVGREEAQQLSREVREHEPDEALFAPGHATAILEAIVDTAWRFLSPAGLLALEIGETHADNVVGRITAAKENGLPAYAAPRVCRDLTGRPRLVLAERRPDTIPAQGGAWPPPPR